ncbi:uncharacterized protein LOC116347332 [Contarinia nasturtii]|uniref:uncharacterized protein LOC116347332 n=1 Tax=Contarinia nasturtii TaxID=265458 RepID=UPI0012D4941D|nr:uncharacterized protein LOC116347332 [Contarinia nasturtii]
MKLLYGLALALIFFEGFISQCEGASGSEEASTSINLKNLPNNVYEEILFRTGFSATEQAAKDNQRSLTAVKKIFEDRIIQICPMNWDDEEVREETLDGNIYLNIYGGDRILSLFEHFGELVKKIKIDYEFIDEVDEDIRQQINENIIKKYAKQFTEFHIIVRGSFLAFLNELSDGGERIHFPNVKKLVYQGPNFGNSYDLNAIFPNLESLNFYYNRFFMSHSVMQINMTCMENVTKLKELKLEINRHSYIQRELQHFLAKNKQISTLKIVIADKTDILRSIEAHATNLQTLEIQMDNTDFLTHVSEEHPFNMPKLKRLNLRGNCDTSRIINFINSFKKLETLDVWTNNDLIISNFGKLIEIREFITFDLEIIDFKEILESFGRKKHLNIIKWAPVDQFKCDNYKSEVVEINKESKQSHKPTWKINYIKENGYSYGYMMLLRSK